MKYTLLKKPTTLQGKILTIAAIVLVLAGTLALFRITTNTSTEAITEPVLTMVTLLPLAELATEEDDLVLSGTLRSKSEADLRVEIPGRLTAVYAQVGAWVKSGTLIAQVENSAQRAQVTQALGALQAAKAQVLSAKAQLAKTNNGATKEDRSIVESQVAAAISGVSSTQDAARNALQAAYAGTVNMVSFGSDTMMHDATSVNPTLKFQTIESSAKIQTENMRVAVGDILARHATLSAYTLSTTELENEITRTKNELITLRGFADSLLTALGGGITTAQVSPVLLGTYTATINTARAQVLANISAITGAQTNIAAADAALATAQKNNIKVVSNVRPEDVAAAEAAVNAAQASVTSALGSYQAALAGLEKTRIRATISGTLASFSARRGDFVGTTALGRIVGTGGTEVVFAIPSTDKSRVAVGNAVLVSGTVTGTITSVSNSTNAFNQQLEVRADLTSQPGAPNGAIVRVALPTTTKNTPTQTALSIIIPINALKFSAQETSLFTVADTMATTTTLVALPVTLGTITGSMVAVYGVDATTLVVTDARGLSAGQDVELSLPKTILLEN